MEIVLGMLKTTEAQTFYFDSQFHLLKEDQQKKLVRKTAITPGIWNLRDPESKKAKLMPQPSNSQMVEKFPNGLTAEQVWDFAEDGQHGFFWKGTVEKQKKAGSPKQRKRK